jgi:hypothetical protein
MHFWKRESNENKTKLYTNGLVVVVVAVVPAVVNRRHGVLSRRKSEKRGDQECDVVHLDCRQAALQLIIAMKNYRHLLPLQ